MRSISGARNRLVLVLAALAALLGGAWLIAAWAGVQRQVSQLDPVLPKTKSSVSDLIHLQAGDLAKAAIAVAAVLVIIGVVLLLLQIPSKPTTTRLRLRDAAGADLAGLDPSVIGRALRERLEESTGISGANVLVTGNAAAPQVYADIDIVEDAELSWVISAAREQLAHDVRMSLGAAPVRVDVIARLTTRARGGSSNTADVSTADHRLS